jgi:hypothetical protein
LPEYREISYSEFGALGASSLNIKFPCAIIIELEVLLVLSVEIHTEIYS